jgi:hypothetical protein
MSDNDNENENENEHVLGSVTDVELGPASSSILSETSAGSASTFMKRLRESLGQDAGTGSIPDLMGPEAQSNLAKADARMQRASATKPSEKEQNAVFLAEHGLEWGVFCGVLCSAASRFAEASRTYIEIDVGAADDAAAAAMPMTDALTALTVDLRTMKYVHAAQLSTTCKICQDHAVDVALQPCGHVLCRDCSYKLGPTCPFCCTSFYTTQKLFFA